ncbi:ADP-glyceromanno-heptose 6-epimerase [Acidisphaera sp. L21]|uniref:ADP-glyceromanno-heptose 6-epimerase n=1 Tax=Acidisphaera sp. L21 TaxID=1641851 RepID=UPI00131AA45E|nr:ADP-glyceromanno-heptose 6-epimerase [Acidisphaera sp. L21]
MILITGGAGFIGSNLNAALAEAGHEVAIVDWLGEAGKWRNLAAYPPAQILMPDALEHFLASDPPLKMVFHLGAISATTATDGDLVWMTNVELPMMLWNWCAAHQVRLVYASSAATYGDGSAGFDDDIDALATLKPRNLYGWSKHAFDLRVAKIIRTGGARPPQWAGLKFFNVYGPNEYHKGSMISVVKIKWDDIQSGRAPKLFRSIEPGLADGQQIRDFIWVGDVVDVMLWLLASPGVNGLFNLGTGNGRSYQHLAEAVCRAAQVPERVEFIDMPSSLRAGYQSFTQANMDRLRAAGYDGQFTILEEGIRRYVVDYLESSDPYR